MPAGMAGRSHGREPVRVRMRFFVDGRCGGGLRWGCFPRVQPFRSRRVCFSRRLFSGSGAFPYHTCSGRKGEGGNCSGQWSVVSGWREGETPRGGAVGERYGARGKSAQGWGSLGESTMGHAMRFGWKPQSWPAPRPRREVRLALTKRGGRDSIERWMGKAPTSLDRERLIGPCAGLAGGQMVRLRSVRPGRR